MRRIFDKDSKLALQVPFEELKIIAKSKDKIYEVFSEKFGLYEIVLPPNDYQIWVERDEKRISKIEQVSAVAGKNIELLLQVEF